jgi:hypothetical protein
MGRVETGLGVFGVLATLFGVGLVLAPGLVGSGPVETAVETVASAGTAELMLVLGGVVAVLVGAVPWRRSRTDGDPFERATEPSTDDTRTDRLGTEVGAAVREGGEAWERVRSELAELAAETYADAANVPPATAEQAVRRGEWTGDDLAAGVLAGGVSRRARLRLWLTPERERRRRVARTVRAVERLGGR